MNFTKLTTLFLLIIFTFSIPVNGEILVDIFEGVNVYSDVNNSWDYSTRYEILSIKETEVDTSYTQSWQYSFHWGNGANVYESCKPTTMYIDFDIHPNIKTIIGKSLKNVNSSFIESSVFHLMDGESVMGYGIFYMWGDIDDKLLYLYEFESIDSLTGCHTYTISYQDETIFNDISEYHFINSRSGSNQQNMGNIIPSGGLYLLSSHYYITTGAYGGYSEYYTDEMATINTITNKFFYDNDIYYHYNVDDYIGYVEIDNKQSSYRLGLTHNLTSSNTETSNDYYIFDDAYTIGNQIHNNQRNLGVKFDLYIDSTQNYPSYSFVLDNGGNLEDSGYYALIPEPDEPPDYATSELTEFDKTPYNERDNAYIMWNITDYIDLHVRETFTLQIITSGDLHGDNHVSNYGMHDSFNNPRSTGYISHHIYSLMNESINGSISASIKYEYYDPIYNKITIPSSYITTDILSLNYTYVPPDPIDPPPDPDIPINDTPPNQPLPPPDPSGINQTLNTSWSGEYYDLVDGTISGLASPLYNFTSWSLTPVTILTSSIDDYNIIMNESFISSSNDMIIISESINIITTGFHPKIRNLITYYLVWLILLLVLRKR